MAGRRRDGGKGGDERMGRATEEYGSHDDRPRGKVNQTCGAPAIHKRRVDPSRGGGVERSRGDKDMRMDELSIDKTRINV